MTTSPGIRRAAVAALAAALAGLPGTAAAQSGCGASYTVQAGDTLAGIARRCGTTVEALMGANAQVEDPARLSIGWELTIPRSGPGARASLGPDAEVRPRTRGEAARAALAQGTYEVRPGDSFAGIATALQISMRELMAANEGVDPFALRAGQTLRLPADGGAAGHAADNPAAPVAPGPTDVDQRSAGPGQAAPDDREAGSEPDAEEPAAERLMLEGRVRTGAECPVLETPEGELYSLVSADYAFMPGDYVEIEGETVEMSFCMQGKATVRVTSMNAVRAPQGG